MFKKFTALIFFICCYSISHASEYDDNLAKWRNAATKEIREKIARNNIYGPDSGRLTVSNYDKTKRMVESSISQSANIDGSKATVKSNIKVPVSAAKSASTLLKRLGKGGIAGMVGGYALQELVDAVGWFIEDNKIYKVECDGNSEYFYRISGGFSNSLSNTCSIDYCSNAQAVQKLQACYVANNFTVISCSYSDPGSCTAKPNWNKLLPEQTMNIKKTKNPQYNSDQHYNKIEVTENELASEINSKLDSGSVDTLIKDAYTPQNSSGSATTDLSEAVSDLNDTIKDLTDALTDVIKSDDPVSTGKTDAIPNITYNNTTITNNSTSTTVNNETGETTETTETGKSDFQFPAFCDWAMTMCTWYRDWTKSDEKIQEHITEEKSFWQTIKDFLDWTKEEPELKEDDQEFEIEDKELDKQPASFDKSYLNYGGQCPVIESKTITVGPIIIPLDYNISPLCDFAITVRPAILALAYLAAMGIVANAIRST